VLRQDCTLARLCWPRNSHSGKRAIRIRTSRNHGMPAAPAQNKSVILNLFADGA